MITAAGVGSGIDVESILSQLNELERQPVNVLNQKRDALQVELSAYGTVKGALSGFQTAARALGDSNSFGAYAASSSDEEVFTATATGGKSAASFDVEVLSLATTHRLASDAYDSPDATVKKGTLSFSAGDNDFDISIDGSNDTLTGLRDAINDAQDNESISASIINVDGGSHLVLTARESGTDGEISFSASGQIRKINFDEISEATDANLIVEGFAVTSSSNTVSGVVEGITLQLTGVGEARAESARDTTSLRTSVDEFVKKYNSMAETLEQLAKSQLQGDQLPRGIDTRMREAFQVAVDLGDGNSTSALELGFTFDRYGKLSIDETRFNAALDQGVERYVNAFARDESGLSARFTKLIDEYTQAGGIIDTREDGVDTRRNSLDDQIDRLEYRIDKTSQRLRRQFTEMDRIVSNLQSTSSFLVSRLSTQSLQR